MNMQCLMSWFGRVFKQSPPWRHNLTNTTFFYFLTQTFDPQQPPAIQSRAFNDPLGDGDSLACFDRSDPLPVDDSSPFSAPSPFIPSMHFFIGRIWDRGLKGVSDFFNRYPLYIALGWCTTRVMLEMACWSLLEKSSCPPPLCLCHLPILLFGPKLHTFSTKATIRDIGQFGTHCHRLPITKINLVKMKTLDASFENFYFQCYPSWRGPWRRGGDEDDGPKQQVVTTNLNI